jgi:hypothetical protein
VKKGDVQSPNQMTAGNRTAFRVAAGKLRDDPPRKNEETSGEQPLQPRTVNLVTVPHRSSHETYGSVNTRLRLAVPL